LPDKATPPRVLIVWDRPADFQDLLARRFPDLRFEFAASPAAVDAALQRLDPEIVFSIKHERFPVETHRMAAAHPSVQWVQVGGSGYEHLETVDLSRLVLTNATGVLARFLAETVTGVMLAWNSHLFQYRDQQRDRLWQALPFVPLRDRVLLVIGAGAIGQCVAENARALGMRVLGANRDGRPVAGVDEMCPLTDIERVLPKADYVSVHLRLNDQTRHFIDRARLAAMKPGVFVMNTARGPVVDQEALAVALESGHLSGAYLDVFDTEPLPAGHRFWGMDNVFITPHAADAVRDWPRRFAALFADNLERWLDAEPLLNRVDTAR